MIGWWIWHNFKTNHSKTGLEGFEKDAYMLYSTVSSNILKAIADIEGKVIETKIKYGILI
jgi:hypothetical protein